MPINTVLLENIEVLGEKILSEIPSSLIGSRSGITPSEITCLGIRVPPENRGCAG
jgi:hypothetical protein